MSEKSCWAKRALCCTSCRVATTLCSVRVMKIIIFETSQYLFIFVCVLCVQIDELGYITHFVHKLIHNGSFVLFFFKITFSLPCFIILVPLLSRATSKFNIDIDSSSDVVDGTACTAISMRGSGSIVCLFVCVCKFFFLDLLFMLHLVFS